MVVGAMVRLLIIMSKLHHHHSDDQLRNLPLIFGLCYLACFTLTLTGLTQLHWKNAIFILPTKTFLVIRDGTLVIKAPLALYIYWIYI